MGTSYETMLVTAGIDEVEAAVEAAGSGAVLVTVAQERTAVIPREGDYDYALTYGLATLLSKVLHCPVLTFAVADSDVVYADVFRDGEAVHEYVSRQQALVTWSQESDGTWTQTFRGVTYPAEVALPTGPIGDDPMIFAPFAAGTPDRDTLAIALSHPQPFADHQHWDIVEALNLDPRGLTVAFRRIDIADFPGARMVEHT